MNHSMGKIILDKQLNIEVLTLAGEVEKLPNHFHDYYELGYIATVSYTHLTLPTNSRV